VVDESASQRYGDRGKTTEAALAMSPTVRRGSRTSTPGIVRAGKADGGVALADPGRSSSRR